MSVAPRALAFAVALLVAVLSGGACATVAPGTPATPAMARRPPRHIDGASLHIRAPQFSGADFAYLDGNTGAQLSTDEVLRRMRAAQVVILGEQHDQAAHHELQRRWVATLAADGPALAVGLEMLSWEHQPSLDKLNRGELEVDAMAEAVAWQKAWGFPFSLYRPIFMDGHAAGAQFFALNVPRDVVRAVRKRGLDGLSAEERAGLPELDLGDALHRAWFEAIFQQGHPIPAQDVQAFYLAQVLWDEGMADRSVKALDKHARQVVVLCGVGHVARGRGVPQRIERRRPSTRVLSLVPLSEVGTDDLVQQITEAVLRGEGDIIAIPRAEEALTL